jgi:hypothetical protein
VSRSEATGGREPGGHDVPARFDAEFAFRCGPERLARLAAPKCAEPWLVSFAAWLRGRGVAVEAPPPRRAPATVEGFPAGSLPILAVRNGGGELALVRAVGRGGPLAGEPEPVTAGDGEFNAATTGAMRAVRQTARRFLPEARAPQLRFEHDPAARLGGPSAALPTAILVWSELLGFRLPDDLVATGGFDAHGRFTPVEPTTLPAKFAAARAWGYRRILVVDGQEIPAACDDPSRRLEVHRVPSDPARLLAFLLPVIEGSVRGDRAAARAAIMALLAVDLATDDGAGIAAIEPVVAPFLGPETPPNLRLLAHDLRSRHLLHEGRTGESRHHHEIAESLVGRDDRPEGVLGDLFVYARPAHAQILALDRGEFGQDTPAALAVESALEELDRKWKTRHERLMRVFLRHARAWRLNFAGRLRRDPGPLREAWRVRAALVPEWPELLERFARGELGRSDTSTRRAEGELLDIGHAIALLGATLPDGARELIGSFAVGGGPVAETSRHGDFELVGWLRRRSVLGQGIAREEFDEIARLLATPDAPLDFPATRSAELTLLASSPADPWALPIARRLAASVLFRDDRAPEDSILRVLSLRASVVIRPILGEATPSPLVPREGTSLRRLFDDLATDPASIAIRCPY